MQFSQKKMWEGFKEVKNFHDFDNTYRKEVYAYAYHLVKDVDNAKDITQAVLIKFYEKNYIGEIRNPRQLIKIIVYRITINYIRDRKRPPEVEGEYLRRKDDDKSIEKLEQLLALAEKKLDEIDLEIFKMKARGESTGNIAKKVNRANKTVQNRWFKIRKKLKTAFFAVFSWLLLPFSK